MLGTIIVMVMVMVKVKVIVMVKVKVKVMVTESHCLSWEFSNFCRGSSCFNMESFDYDF